MAARWIPRRWMRSSSDSEVSIVENDAPNQRQYLTFFLADEQYAVGVLSVKEIIEYGIGTKVPTTPPYVRGVINLRGSVVPVIDLAIKF